MQLTLEPTASVERFTLRDYQIEFINKLYLAIRGGHSSIACVAPTGSGKTIIISQVTEHAVGRGRRVLILVHLDVLVGQTYDKLKAFGLDFQAGFIKAGWEENREAPVQIGSVQTLGRRRWWEKTCFDVVIYDEAHTTAFTQVGRKIRESTHPDAIHLAFTATPYRLGKRVPQIGDICSTLVAAPTPAKLQALGQLASMRYFGLPPVDLSGVKMVGGDFNEADLKNRCDTPALIDRIVAEWHRLTPGKRTIAFCVGVDHAHHVAEAFRRSGVPAATVTGNTPIEERRRLYKGLRDGDPLVLTSCNVISIGFDEPSVEVGLLLRPTTSLALHHQQIGRVMRMSPGKEAGIILDQAGNLIRLGMPEDIEEYELLTADKSDRKPGEPVKKACPTCLTVLSTFATVCPNCGHIFPGTEPTQVDADLIEYTRTSRERRMESAYRTLVRRAYRKGFDPAWAAVRFRDKYGEYPVRNWSIGAVFGESPTDDDRVEYYLTVSEIAKAKGKHINWVIASYQGEFGVSDKAIYKLIKLDSEQCNNN